MRVQAAHSLHACRQHMERTEDQGRVRCHEGWIASYLLQQPGSNSRHLQQVEPLPPACLGRWRCTAERPSPHLCTAERPRAPPGSAPRPPAASWAGQAADVGELRRGGQHGMRLHMASAWHCRRTLPKLTGGPWPVYPAGSTRGCSALLPQIQLYCPCPLSLSPGVPSLVGAGPGLPHVVESQRSAQRKDVTSLAHRGERVGAAPQQLLLLRLALARVAATPPARVQLIQGHCGPRPLAARRRASRRGGEQCLLHIGGTTGAGRVRGVSLSDHRTPRPRGAPPLLKPCCSSVP